MTVLSEDQEALVLKLQEKISFLDELIKERQEEFRSLTKETNRVNDYFQGASDSMQKIDSHLSLQKKNILDLHAKQQLNVDAFNFIDGLLNATLHVVKKNTLENEKISLTKQIEHANKNAEIVKLISKKDEYLAEINKINNPIPEPPLPPQAYTREITAESKIKNRKYRPDKNPNTKAGRASLDLAARRKEARESLKITEEQNQSLSIVNSID